MAILIFRSKAAGEIVMLSDAAYPLLDLLGKTQSARGVLTADELPAAIGRLEAAVTADRAAAAGTGAPAQRGSGPDGAEASGHAAVSLSQRAYPLLEMMRAAAQRHTDVTWGV